MFVRSVVFLLVYFFIGIIGFVFFIVFLDSNGICDLLFDLSVLPQSSFVNAVLTPAVSAHVPFEPPQEPRPLWFEQDVLRIDGPSSEKDDQVFLETAASRTASSA